MKFIRISFVLAIITGSLLLTGCELLDEQAEEPGTGMELDAELALQALNFYTADADLAISFQFSQATMPPEMGLRGTPILSFMGFIGSDGCRGDLVFGQDRIACDPGNSYGMYPEQFDRSLYQYIGQEVPISFSSPEYRFASTDGVDLYVPNAVHVSSPQTDVLGVTGQNGVVSRNMPLRWVPDAHKDKMVIIASNPHSILNETVPHGGRAEHIVTNVEIVEDDGSHVLTDNLLKGFPKGEKVKLYFMRVSLAVEELESSKGTEKVKLYAYSMATYSGTLQ